MCCPGYPACSTTHHPVTLLQYNRQNTSHEILHNTPPSDTPTIQQAKHLPWNTPQHTTQWHSCNTTGKTPPMKYSTTHHPVTLLQYNRQNSSHEISFQFKRIRQIIVWQTISNSLNIYVYFIYLRSLKHVIQTYIKFKIISDVIDLILWELRAEKSQTYLFNAGQYTRKDLVPFVWSLKNADGIKLKTSCLHSECSTTFKWFKCSNEGKNFLLFMLNVHQTAALNIYSSGLFLILTRKIWRIQ